MMSMAVVVSAPMSPSITPELSVLGVALLMSSVMVMLNVASKN